MRTLTPEQEEVSYLLKLPENYLCADCQRNRPKWASCNLGVFICLECSGVHRSLGTHISFVRSCNLDTWTKEQVMKMKYIGNEAANEYWEARLPAGFKRPLPGDKFGMTEFIRNKYVRKMWVKPKVKPPNLQPLSALKCRSEEDIHKFAQECQPEQPPKDDFDVDEVLRQIDGFPTRQKSKQTPVVEPEKPKQKLVLELEKPATEPDLAIPQDEEDFTFKMFLEKEENPDFGFLLEEKVKDVSPPKESQEPEKVEVASEQVEDSKCTLSGESEPKDEFTIPTAESSTESTGKRSGPGRFEELKDGVKRLFGSIFGRRERREVDAIEEKQDMEVQPVPEVGSTKEDEDKNSKPEEKAQTMANSQSPIDRFLAFQDEISSSIGIEQSALADFFEEKHDEVTSTTTVSAKTATDTTALSKFFDDDEQNHAGLDSSSPGEALSLHAKQAETKPAKPTDPQGRAKNVFTLKPDGNDFDAFGFVALDSSDS